MLLYWAVLVDLLRNNNLLSKRPPFLFCLSVCLSVCLLAVAHRQILLIVVQIEEEEEEEEEETGRASDLEMQARHVLVHTTYKSTFCDRRRPKSLLSLLLIFVKCDSRLRWIVTYVHPEQSETNILRGFFPEKREMTLRTQKLEA